MNEIMVRTPEVIAVEINNIKEQTKKMVLFNSIEIGRRLVEAKAMIGHGDWGNWLEKTVDYSQRTANNLMKIFEEYGSNQIVLFGDNAKSQAFANLSYTQAVALLGIPQDEREQFIEENDIEDMSTRELQKAIKERDEAIEEKEKLSTKLKNTEEYAKEIAEERDKLSKSHEELKKENEKQSEEAERLRKELDEAKETGDDEEIEKLKNSLKKAEEELEDSTKKIKELDKQLKEKPIEVPATVEKIPNEVERELSELRKKAQEFEANKESDKAILKFTVHFESLVSEFNDLLGAMGEIMVEEVKEKYKNAVKGLLGKMSERL